MASSILFTSQPNAADLALSELRTSLPGTRLERWITPGVGLAQASGDWRTLADALLQHPPIFIRHLCPATIHFPLEHAPDDLEILAHYTREFLLQLDTTRTYSVQTRALGEGTLGEGWPYTRFDINNRLAAILGEWGAPLDVQHPAQILSVTLTPSEVFLGFSLARENLSDWAGGERRFKREPGQISRAEFKLLEALETFDLQLPPTGLALDMGAAPGGWTRLLAARGLRVIAVDPAELDPRVETLSNVTHIRATVENYLPTRETFDLLLNDMRMDARDSARVMLMAAKYLKPKGFAVMTLKLPEKGMGEVARAALRILASGYSILGARQLFHNRDEVTVAVSR